MGLKGRDLLSIRDLSKEDIEEILKAAHRMLPYAEGKKVNHLLDGKILTLAFFEPSTRTRLSFETAMARLGGTSVTIADASVTSVKKGETLHDTVRVISQYGDAIVLRHPNEGAARLAARASAKPVINAGDGTGEHPTQTLIDLAAMQEAFGKIAGLRVTLLGDLKYGRTVHSLARALALFGARLVVSSPPSLRLPVEVREDLDRTGVEIREIPKVEDAIQETDVLYVTRIQRERFGDDAEYAEVAGSYRVDLPLLARAPERLVVLHPLPRIGEIGPAVDDSPHAAYFRQAFLGVPVRMALLALTLAGRAS